LAIAGLAAAGIVAVSAIGIGGDVSAQTPDDAKSRRERYRELLAAELGITVEALTEAQTTARDQLIDEALAAGDITEEQAERLKELEPGEGLRLGIGAHMLGHKLHRALFGALEAASDIVDEPVDELRERIAGGESLAEIAASKNIDEETLKNDLVTALTERINQAMTDGDIDEEKADMLLENLDAFVERAIDVEGPFEMRFRFGGPRGERFLDGFIN
jgi:hypothetical protein